MTPEEYYPIPPTKIQKAIICTPEEVQMWKDENLKLKTRITELEAQVAALKKIAISERERRHIADMSRFGIWDYDSSPDPRKLAEDQLTEEHPEAFG